MCLAIVITPKKQGNHSLSLRIGLILTQLAALWSSCLAWSCMIRRVSPLTNLCCAKLHNPQAEPHNRIVVNAHRMPSKRLENLVGLIAPGANKVTLNVLRSWRSPSMVRYTGSGWRWLTLVKSTMFLSKHTRLVIFRPSWSITTSPKRLANWALLNRMNWSLTTAKWSTTVVTSYG